MVIAAPPPLPDSLVRTFQIRADETAQDVGRLLVAMQLAEFGPDGRPELVEQIPFAVLMDLAACCYLNCWDDSGLTDFMLGLPDWQQAFVAVDTRLRSGGYAGTSLDDANLWHQVNRVLCEQLAWDGPTIYQSEFVIAQDASDEEEFLDLVANFIWNIHRSRDLARLE